MSRVTLVNEIGEWLIDQALRQSDIVELFDELCTRLSAVGLPISRARLMWPTLHPLFQAETVIWMKGRGTEFEQFKHQDEVSDEWKASPIAHVIENKLEVFRRNLDGPNKILDFPILEELAAEGHTDYMLIATGFDGSRVRDARMTSGILVMWSSDRIGGFSDDDVMALRKIQRRFAVACKNIVQHRIATNITQTYLGIQAGQEVLEGAIKLGDGRETDAVVWYTDMRCSTALADTMDPSQFLELLNDYFEVTAGPAITFGGEVLDFIGDAVLAIFPYDEEQGVNQAIRCATMAMDMALEQVEIVNERRRQQGKVAFDFGIGINIGRLTFGNIGVPSRLAFSVIGPTINEAERIETLTKTVESRVLVSRDVTLAEPERWTSMGMHRLEGVASECELFAPLPETQVAVDTMKANKKAAVTAH